AVLRKLSLNAAKNWHQKRGANFLDSSKGAGMLSYYCKVTGAPPPDNTQKTRPCGRELKTGGHRSKTDIFLIRFHDLRPESEAKSNPDNDREECNPHGSLPLPPAQTSPGKSGQGNAWRQVRFPYDCEFELSWMDDCKSDSNMRKSSSRNSK